jgi:hypothetical protein
VTYLVPALHTVEYTSVPQASIPEVFAPKAIRVNLVIHECQDSQTKKCHCSELFFLQIDRCSLSI